MRTTGDFLPSILKEKEVSEWNVVWEKLLTWGEERSSSRIMRSGLLARELDPAELEYMAAALQKGQCRSASEGQSDTGGYHITDAPGDACRLMAMPSIIETCFPCPLVNIQQGRPVQNLPSIVYIGSNQLRLNAAASACRMWYCSPYHASINFSLFETTQLASHRMSGWPGRPFPWACEIPSLLCRAQKPWRVDLWTTGLLSGGWSQSTLRIILVLPLPSLARIAPGCRVRRYAKSNTCGTKGFSRILKLA